MPPSHKCTPAIRDEIAGYLEDGDFLTVACSLAGITDAAAYKWLDRGRTEIERRNAGLTNTQRREQGLPTRAAEQPFVEFVEAVTRARAIAERKHQRNVERIAMGGEVIETREESHPDGTVVKIEKRALGDWRASAFYLERVHPKRWGRRQAIEVSGPEGGPIGIDASVGARLTARLEDYYRRVREADPRVIDVQAVRPELPAGTGTGADDDGRSDGAEPGDGPAGAPDGE